MAPPVKAEKKYIKYVSSSTGEFYRATKNSVQEGFEYFESESFTKEFPNQKMSIRNMLFANGIGHLVSMLKIFGKCMAPIMRGRKECFTDLKDYIDELKISGKIKRESDLIATFPNKDVWQELTEYAWKKWKVSIGFTELPEDLIFKGKAVLFKHVLVCIQEMDKSKIDQAPNIDAGGEVQRVYNSLGHAVNDIARWLRNNYSIKCQSNHPLGGLVNTPPLAGKAGMGWQGMDGMLITPQYGKRVRIAPIFIDGKYFEYTDSNQHAWIEQFCESCRKCQRKCPTQAIYKKRKVANKNIPGLTIKTCIDRTKCFPQFTKTLGCSICLKVCPFSGGKESYLKIKKGYEKRRKKNNNSPMDHFEEEITEQATR